LRILGLTYPPQTWSEVQRFIKQHKINYRVALGSESIKSLFDESDVLPVTVVIDREGNVREVIKGVLYEDEFAEKVKPLLGPATQKRTMQNQLR